MMYHVAYTKEARKALNKMDNYVSTKIAAWIGKNLDGCSNPRRLGKALTANHRGQWRYRIGDYRLIADIQDDKVVILIVAVSHRKDVYED